MLEAGRVEQNAAIALFKDAQALAVECAMKPAPFSPTTLLTSVGLPAGSHHSTISDTTGIKWPMRSGHLLARLRRGRQSYSESDVCVRCSDLGALTRKRMPTQLAKRNFPNRSRPIVC